MPIDWAIENFIAFQILQPISIIGKCFKDLERPDVSRSKLSFDTKSLGSFHRRNTEIDMITNVESQITMLAVIVALLT